MSLSHLTRRMRVIGAAAAAATVALAASAQADASTQLTNAGTIATNNTPLAMEVGFDGRVLLKPSNPASFRQQWQKEPGINGASRYRNLATSACLIVPSSPSTGADLRVGQCFNVGNRNLWRTSNIVPGNGAFEIVSAQDGTTPVPNFFGSDSSLKLHPAGSVATFGSFLEYVGA